MQELEKILEEIRVKSIELKNKHWGDDERNLTGKGVECMCVQAEQIIRKHMNGGERFEFDFMNVKSFDCQCGRHYVNIGVARNDGWIPVEERLPESEGDKVMVCSKKGNIDTGIYSPYTGKWFIGNMSALSKDIIAWRPLPETYRLEEKN